MVVAHVISGLMFGGGQQVALDLLGEFASEPGMQAHLILLGNGRVPLSKDATRSVDYDGRYDHPQTVVKTACALRGELGKLEVDVVHSHGWDADFISSLAVRGTKRGHLIHLHVWPEWLRSSKLKHGIRRSLSRWMMTRRHTETIAVSNAVLECWTEGIRVGGGVIRVIRNGVNLERFSPISRARSSRPIIGTAARLAAAKGLTFLIEAVATLKLRGIDSELRIAGAGSYRPRLEADVAQFGLRDRVKFFGQVADMSHFYGSLDLFVLPSLSEGLPLTVLEAMACGIAVVATDVGGVSEVIDDHQDGILVEPGDHEALAGAMAALLADDSRRVEMGRRARQKVEREFALESVGQQFVDRYRALTCSAAD